jgi:uncharacterized cupredoxin-like copper-binding protein
LRLIVLIAVVATSVALAATGIAVARDHSQAATTVKVTAKDFSFKLSTKTARHGTVTFKVVNKGPTKHDFKIAGKKTKLLKKGGKATLTVTLKKKTYQYICTVPGHTALGMKGKFKAT